MFSDPFYHSRFKKCKTCDSENTDFENVCLSIRKHCLRILRHTFSKRGVWQTSVETSRPVGFLPDSPFENVCLSTRKQCLRILRHTFSKCMIRESYFFPIFELLTIKFF